MKRPATTEMPTQPFKDLQNMGLPMRQSPSNKSKTARNIRPSVSSAEAEVKRRGSLKKQRSQLAAVKRVKVRPEL